MDSLPQDDRFIILLHKKIMNKTGSAKRRAKKYYMDQYRKSGMIPKALFLASQGVMEGRKCSGRKRVLDEAVRKRFVDMVRASSDRLDPGFIFITQKARTIKNYHQFLQDEFKKKISLAALRRCAKAENLAIYLHKPDFEELPALFAFKEESVLDLVQMDGCVMHYLKIRRDIDVWQKPNVIELYDTGARHLFVLEIFFSESSLNAVEIFKQFLLSTPFPQKQIRLRPDNSPGFSNLKRSIHALNIEHSVPDGFYLKADFARKQTPKDKAHLESSHRSLHNFEIRIIKAFENRIVKTEPGYIFNNGKKQKIVVTYLDIDLDELRESGIIETYRIEHNNSKHCFSVEGKTMSWIPSQKLQAYLTGVKTISFSAEHVKEFIKYGFDKIKATVSVKGTITFQKQTYIVVEGAEKFSRHQSTKVYISAVKGKLLIFEFKEDGILLGEAICQQPFEKPDKTSLTRVKENELEQIIDFLCENTMVVDRITLIECHRKGLNLPMAKTIYERNRQRYDNYRLKLRQPPEITGMALFNAFILDCSKHQRSIGYGDK
jgi:hypothetical protein